MKRIAILVLLTLLSSPASARGGYSFVVRGHRVHIAAHCRSLSCVYVSGIGRLRGHRDDDVATVNDPVPAPAPAAQPAPPPVIAPPAPVPPTAHVTPPPAPAPPVVRAQAVPPAPVAPVQAQPSPVPAPTLASAPAVGFETPKPQQNAAPSAPAVRPVEDKPVTTQPAARVTPSPVARVSQQNEEDDDSPVGDWQTEARNGLVHIETCGPGLCGFMLDATTRARGESILVNMKPTKANQWAGNIFSRSSGNSYYGTMTLKEGNTLRVEACALGSFFCSGNNWTRFEDNRSVRPGDVANSRRDTPPPPHS